jgi:hypothetical protein
LLKLEYKCCFLHLLSCPNAPNTKGLVLLLHADPGGGVSLGPGMLDPKLKPAPSAAVSAVAFVLLEKSNPLL